MNATPPSYPEDDAERTARHLRLCAELADLAMQLARAAATRALANWAEPAAAEAAQPLVTQAAAPPADPEARPSGDLAPATASRAAGAASPKSADPAVLFTRFAAIARHCITLERRLAAAAATTTAASPSQNRAPQHHADARRPLLLDTFARALKNHPDRATLQRETTTRLDAELAADPDQMIPAGNLYVTICRELGIEIDLASLPNALLSTYSAPRAHNGTAYPRATSPP